MGAERIGHGIMAAWSEDMIKELADKNIPLELCPTSNLNTKVVDNIADYPIKMCIRDRSLPEPQMYRQHNLTDMD